MSMAAEIKGFINAMSVGNRMWATQTDAQYKRLQMQHLQQVIKEYPDDQRFHRMLQQSQMRWMQDRGDYYRNLGERMNQPGPSSGVDDAIQNYKGGKPQSALPTGSTGPDGAAISGIESGGKYNELGPVIKSGAYAGDRAYGKYQVMGKNIPEWTKEVLGQSMTPQQFLADPQAQDKVFNTKFGQLRDKYGPEGAARAWFAGEGGMNNLARTDQLGTSVGSYGQQFAQNRASALPVGQGGPGAMPYYDENDDGPTDNEDSE